MHIKDAMDAKIWTVGATLFALLYLTLGVMLVWSAVVVALILAAWVMGLETEGPEGLKYVELELRPALSFVGIFALTVVFLGPHFPPIFGSSLFPVQYASPTKVLHTTPLLFYFPLLPLITGSLMTMHRRLHPVQGFLYQTPPAPSTKVHVHLHTTKAASRSDDDEEEDEEDEPSTPRHGHRSGHARRALVLRRHLGHHARPLHAVKAAGEEEDDEDDDDADHEPLLSHRSGHRARHANRQSLHANESGEL